MVNFSPFPNIGTKNLNLRRMRLEDAEDLFEMRKDPRMIEYTDSKLDESIDETIAYINKMNQGIDENKWIIWVLEHKETGKVIGSISIWNLNWELESGELGFGIIPEYQGRGFMKEALQSVVEFGFEGMKLRQLEAYTEESNLPSKYLLSRCDFVDEDRVDEVGYYSERVYHMLVFRRMR